MFGRTTSNGEDFSSVNPLLYVPVLALENDGQNRPTETAIIISYLADRHPEAGLVPTADTLARAKVDQLLTLISTEIAQKHIPLMRGLLTVDGTAWTRSKLVNAYAVLDRRLADAPYLNGDHFSVVDAYAWATMWHERSGADIGHLQNLMDWKQRMDGRPSVRKSVSDEAEMVETHNARKAA